ncbi:unnamed protein product [Ectocarpus sp. 8 AP-2014]
MPASSTKSKKPVKKKTASSTKSKKPVKKKTASSTKSKKPVKKKTTTTTKPRKRASARTQKAAPVQLYHPQYYTNSQPYPQQYQQRQYAPPPPPPQHYPQHSYQHYPNYIHPFYGYSAYGGLVGVLKGNTGATGATGATGPAIVPPVPTPASAPAAFPHGKYPPPVSLMEAVKLPLYSTGTSETRPPGRNGVSDSHTQTSIPGAMGPEQSLKVLTARPSAWDSGVEESKGNN